MTAFHCLCILFYCITSKKYFKNRIYSCFFCFSRLR